MNVKIIGIVAVIIVVIIAGMGLMAISDPTHESDAWDGDDNTNTDNDATDGTWQTQLSVKLTDGRVVDIPIDGNALQTAPLSVNYGGQEVVSFQYALFVTAYDPEGYYDEVSVQALGTPEVQLTSMSPSPVIYERQPAYPFDADTIPCDGSSNGVVLAEFNASTWNYLPEGSHQMRFDIWRGTNEGFQYKLPDQTDWTTASDPDDLYLTINVEHGGEFTISFDAATATPTS